MSSSFLLSMHLLSIAKKLPLLAIVVTPSLVVAQTAPPKTNDTTTPCTCSSRIIRFPMAK
ncbi:hypothetical protein [Hymenobacter radiodurans]|uniref:hypothetical protein n=1 Tax=Hymenobacter radiodurans TaxID=2496028 RepID=UPI00105880D8|nr:hypothetical protein [Hymenobacter radiodurans]